MFPGFLAVRESESESVHAFQTVLTQYFEKYWKYFHQTFSSGVFWDKGGRFKFWDQKVKVQGHSGSSQCYFH